MSEIGYILLATFTNLGSENRMIFEQPNKN